MAELELEKDSPEVKELTRKALAETREGIVSDCAGQLPQAQARCMIAAKDRAALDACAE